MRVAIYARYSTDLQDRTSIDGQIANCEALAGREGLEIVARYQDEGRSGNDDQRDGYQDMLARLKRGEFVGIVCDETSRITRNQAELHRLTAELRFRDQFLITCDGIDTRSESSDLVLSVKAAIDQMEGRKIGYRTYRSLRERHKAGHSAGGKIYGYTSEQDGNYRRRVKEPDQAANVLEIFKRYAGGASAKTIVRDFNERGIPSPGSFWNNRKRRAAGWVHTTLLGSYSKASGILRNPIYTGRVTWNKRSGKKVPGTGMRIQKRRPDAEWIEYQDESLRIVSDELWGRVQERLKTARSRTNSANLRGRPARHLLSGLLICSSCGGHYVVRNGKSYACSSQSNGRDSLCSQRIYLKKSVVESQLLAGIKDQLLQPNVVKKIAKQARTEARRLSQGTEDRSEQMKGLDRQIADLADTIIEIGKSDVLTERLRKLEKQKEAISRQASREIRTVLPRITDRWRELVTNLEALPTLAKPDELETARSVLHDLIGTVSIVEDGDHVFADTMLCGGTGYNSGNDSSAPKP